MRILRKELSRVRVLPLVAFIMVLATPALGCASAKPKPRYVPARVVKDEPPPAAAPITVQAPEPQPGQLKANPWKELKEQGEHSSEVASDRVIDKANRAAAQGPDESGYFNAVMEYSFAPGALFQIYTAPMRVTDLMLQPGERIVGQPASGDTVRWVLAVGKSIDSGLEQWHVYIKPTRPGLHTNLAINTDKRTYLVELHSFKESYMAAVKWRYPQEELAKLTAETTEAAEHERNSAPVASLEKLNFRYVIKVVEGKPVWAPLQVFDDGEKTFIRFPPTMRSGESPALFVLRDDQTQLVNYRVRQEFYVVDRLFQSAVLRVGQQSQEVVRIDREDD
jgi:P-type conjugative transfer protein TrbG